MFYVYVLHSSKYDQLYVGSTNDLPKRFQQHQSGNERSTARYRPWKLIYYEAYLEEKLARRREQRLKHHGSAMHALKKRIGLISTTTNQRQSRAGFTLIELMVSVAIFGILTAIIFTSLSKQKSRDAVKFAANQLQVDIQDMQNRAQSGVVVPGGVAAPSSYGFVERSGWNYYILFADQPSTSGVVDNFWDDPTQVGNNGSRDVLIAKRVFSDNKIQFIGSLVDGGPAQIGEVNVVFAGINATPIISISGNSGFYVNSATMVLQHTVLNTCYSVGVQKAGGTVLKRQLATCP